MATVPAQARTWRRRERRTDLLIWACWLFAAALFIACFQMISEKTIWAFVLDAPQQAGDLAVRMVPPDWSYIRALGRPIWDTINIATVGTLIAVLLAIPVAYCAARNTTPSVGLVRPVALFIIVSSRSINALIWALMLVTIIGPGVFAGIIAIALRSIGFCAKLLYEAIEEIDESQVDAVRINRSLRRAGDVVWSCTASVTRIRRHFGVPLGHQYPQNQPCLALSAPVASDLSLTPR